MEIIEKKFSFSYYSSAIHNLSQMSVMTESFCGLVLSVCLANVILESRRGNKWQLIKYWDQPPNHGKMLFDWVWNHVTMDSVVETTTENFLSLWSVLVFIFTVKVMFCCNRVYWMTKSDNFCLISLQRHCDTGACSD